jgi:hypothetical protein
MLWSKRLALGEFFQLSDREANELAQEKERKRETRREEETEGRIGGYEKETHSERKREEIGGRLLRV